MQESPLIRGGAKPTRSRASAILLLPLLVVALLGQVTAANADLAPANGNIPPAAADTRLAKLLRDADAAEATGDLKLALIYLKQAVLLFPLNGDLHARVGTILLRTGAVIPGRARVAPGPDLQSP